MKKNIVIILIIGLLAGVALYLSTTDANNTLSGQLSDFAVEDTASITKIFLADKNNKTITLERTATGWMVNNEYAVRKDIIQVLLETIKKVKVRAPVAKSSFENIVKNIAANSVKVEIYTSNNSSPEKVYYVGGPNPDHTGSYMLLENSSVPFIMHIEGFRGYLTPRYFTNINDWRTTAIFTNPAKNIASIELIYPQSPENSWVITKNSAGSYGVKTMHNNADIPNLDTTFVMRYIKRFESIYFEGIEETKTEDFIDSIKASQPQQIYRVTDINGNVSEIKVYPKPAHPGAEDYDGNPIEYDLDRLYGWLNETDFVVIQYVIFDPLKKLPTEFSKQPNI